MRDFADPQRRAQAAKEVWNIKDAVKAEAEKAGLNEQEAALAAQAYQSAANMFYENTGVMPKDWWEQYRLEIKNDMQKRSQGEADGERFYQSSQEKALDLTAEFSTVKGLTKQNAAQLIEQELNNLIGHPLDTATPPLQIQITRENKAHIKTSNVPLKGGQLVRHQAVLSALEKVVNKAEKTEKDGAVDLTHNTRKRTLAHKAGVDKYVYFKAPIQTEIADANGQKSTLYFEVELAAEQVKGQDPNLLNLYNVRVKNKFPAHALQNVFAGNNNSITKKGKKDNRFGQGEADGERFYQAAAMYKTPHKDFKDFYAAAQNNKGKKQSYYTYSAKSGVDIDIPSDTLLHDNKHPEMTAVEWEKVLGNIDNIERAFAVNGKENARYKGQPVLMKISDDNNAYGVVLEILNNGRILLTTAFKSTGENGADAWLTKEKSAATPDTFIFDFRLTTDKSRRAAFYGRSSSYSLSDIVEKINKKDKFYQAAGARAFVEFGGQGVLMRLLENADPSSIVHEVCGHVLLRNVEDIKSFAEANGGAREEFNALWGDLEKWLGAAERREEGGKVKYRFSRAQQEQFAEGMEKMFAAGKAPTGSLEKLFDYFKRMLSEMYEEARAWLDMRPEVEDIFGRILAGAGEADADADAKQYKGRTAEIKAVSARARKGEAASINGMGIKEVKALIKQLNRRRPAMPKDDLLTVLKRKGADYANAGKVDAEAYGSAGVKDKKGGIGDKLALWLKEEGFLEDSVAEEKAAALIERALNGEKVWRLEDLERVSAVENFDANIEAIREAFGNNVQEAENTLRAIEALQAKGYRVIGDADIEYAEEQSGRLLSYAEREKELKRKIEELTEDKEELANIAERRLADIGRSARLAREEGYKEAIKDARDEKTVKDLLAVEREAQKNALDARRVKNALIEEIEKRELAGKAEMLKKLKAAQSAEEINAAAKAFMTDLYKAFEGSEAGKERKRKTDLPKTDWGRVKLKALEGFNKVASSAGAEIEAARALNEEAGVMRAQGIRPDAKKQAQIDNARGKVLKGYALKYAKALKEALADAEHIDKAWLEDAANRIGREYAGRANIIGRPLDMLIERAKRNQAKNYKAYIAAKTEAMINAGYKVKDGQKQKGKYDYATNKLFEDLKHIKNMDKTAAKEELGKRREIINRAASDAEAALSILGLKGDAESLPADFIDNMKLENAYLAFKAGKMSESEMAMAKESLAEQGLPDTIEDDAWHFVSPKFLSKFYEEVNERRKAAFEGRLSKSMELAAQAQEEKEAFAKAVRANKKGGAALKGYISWIANLESVFNAVANKDIKEKYSLLEAETRAEVRSSEKMKEVVKQAAEAIGSKSSKEVKKWFDSLDEEAGVWLNRIESKRMAVQEAAPALRQSLEAVDTFRKLSAGKNEVILKDFLTFADERGEKKNHNLKIVFNGPDGGLKSIYDAQGLEGVEKAVHAALKGLIVKREDGVIYMRVRNDFAAVLKRSAPGGKSTYTLTDYALFDEKGRQIEGYGISNAKNTRRADNNNVSSDLWPKNLEKRKDGPEISKNLDDITAVKITVAPPVFDKTVNFRNWLLEHFKDINGVKVKETQQKINITKSGIKRSLKRKKENITNRSYMEFKSLLENAKYLGFENVDEKHTGKRGQDIFVSKMEANEKVYDVIFRVDVLNDNTLNYAGHKVIPARDTAFKPLLNGDNNKIHENNDNVNTEKELQWEIKKAALAAAQNALNPYVDGLYKPTPQKLTKGQIIDIYNTIKNPVGYARYENQYGVNFA